MKRIKSSKGYGALEYTLLIAIVVVIALFFFLSIKNKDSTSAMQKGMDAVGEFIGLSPGGVTGGGGNVPGETSSITVTYSGPFNYDFEDEIEVAVENYFASDAVTVRKNGEVRTDYALSGIVRVGNYIQLDVKVDEKTKREQFLVNEICYLATDDDFSPDAFGTLRYFGSPKCVEIPHEIKGVSITSYHQMFQHSDVKKVISTNPNVTNMKDMFENSNATSLDLSELNTSNVTTMFGMFKGSKATSIDLSSFNTSNVTDMDWMFSQSCATTLDLSSFDTSNVTSMWDMFYASKAITLDLSNFHTSNVTRMDAMFGHSEATSIVFGPSFDTSNVTNMRQMFAGSKAEDLDLSNFNTLNVSNWRMMFAYSHAMSLDLSSFDFSKLNSMNATNMFEGAQVIEVLVQDLASQSKISQTSTNIPSHTIIKRKQD